MKLTALLALLMGFTTTSSQAMESYSTVVFNSLEASPLSKQEIIDYQLKASAQQYDDEQAKHYMPIVQQRVENHLTALASGKRSLITVWNKDNQLSGISWLSHPSQDVTRIHQSNCTDRLVYGLFLIKAAQQYPESTHIQTIVNKDRPLLAVLLPKSGWEEIAVYDLEDNHNVENYTAFQIAKSGVSDTLAKLKEFASQ